MELEFLSISIVVLWSSCQKFDIVSYTSVSTHLRVPIVCFGIRPGGILTGANTNRNRNDD